MLFWNNSYLWKKAQTCEIMCYSYGVKTDLEVNMKKSMIYSLFLILVAASLLVGPESLKFESGFKLNEISRLIFWQARVPRTISIILAGSSMSLAGLLMQVISQNRFAAPSTVGTVEAAKLGLLMSIWLVPGVSLSGKMMASFISSVVFTLIFFLLIANIKVKETWTIPLFGMIFGQLISSFASAIAYHFDLVQSLSSWQQGNFALIQNGSFEWLWLSLIVLMSLPVMARPLTIMQLGRSTSQNVGIHYDAMRYLVIAMVALISAVNVITVGTLPYIGVIIPNLVRLFYSDNLRKSVPMVMLGGSLFVLICDLFARTIIRPYEIPVSVIISVCGGCLFLWIVLRRREWQS